MIISLIIFLIFTNALAGNKQETGDSSIFYSRITLGFLTGAILICYNNLYVLNLEKGVGMYHGLFNISSLTQSFSLFVLIITAIVLTNNSFYHRITTLVSPSTENTFSSNYIIKAYNSVVYNILGKKGSYTNYPKYADQEIDFKGKNTALPVNKLSKSNNDINLIPDTKAETYQIVEYALIMNFILCGALFLMTSHDLISLFISIELQSYALYIFSTLHKNSERATWGGLTYFLLGALSSCFILLGMCLIYINTGTTSLDGFYVINSITEAGFTDLSLLGLSSDVANLPNKALHINDFYYINIALSIFIVGFLFKVSAAPFHFWSPDVYDAIPTNVTTYVAIIAKLSIFAFLLELVYYINGDFVNTLIYDTKTFSWKNCILISSLLSLIIGSVLGLTQFRIKRLYAYSTISHVGFILLALSIDRIESIQAYIFYVLSYSLSNLNAFIILIAIGYQMYLHVNKDLINKSESLQAIADLNKVILHVENKGNNVSYKDSLSNDNKATPLKTLNNLYALSYDKTFKSLNLKDVTYSPIQLTNQLKGYFYINPYLSLSLAITLFSFIGIPPLIGFFAKQMVLSAALDNGYIFITLVGIITSVIGAGYYLNIIKIMFFFKPDYVYNPLLSLIGKLTLLNKNIYNKEVNISLGNTLCLIISILTLFIGCFIFIPNESFSIARILALLIFV